MALFERLQISGTVDCQHGFGRGPLGARKPLVQRRHVQRPKDERAFDQISQLANVPGPVVLRQVTLFVAANLKGWYTQLRRQCDDEMRDQVRDVFLVRAKWGQVDLDHLQSVVKVFAKAPCVNFVAQGAVGGGNDAHIHRDLLFAAHRAHAARFYDPQQTGLQGQWHVGNLIKKERAPLGVHKQAVTAGAWGGFRAVTARVPKQFGFDVGRRNRCAIHGHKKPVGLRPQTVQCQRCQLLAGARFARQQHRAGHDGDAAQGFLQTTDDDAVSHQTIGLRRALGQSAFEHPVLAFEARALHALLEGVEQLRHAKGLEQHVAGARPQGFNRRFQIGKGRDEHHFTVVAEFAHFAQQSDAALSGQVDVQDDQVKAMFLQQGIGLIGMPCGQQLPHLGGQTLLQKIEHARLVVHHQNRSVRPVLSRAFGA